MRRLRPKVPRQVDDLNRLEWTSLDTNTATDTQRFRNETDLGRFINLNTQFTRSNHWTTLLAFLLAFFWLALVGVDDRNSEFVC